MKTKAGMATDHPGGTLHNKEIHLSHKTVQRLMKGLDLVFRVRIKKYRSYKEEAIEIAPIR